jgi:hypothetical protein
MITTQEILSALDYANDGYYCSFIPLNHPYSYLIDTRLNLFSSNNDWVIVAEILGYNPRGGRIELQICYYGNCLINLEQYNNRNTNCYSVFPIDDASFEEASLDEYLNPAATTLLIRGQAIALHHEKRAYERAGIELADPNTIGWEEAGRLLASVHHGLFRATDSELYKSIPDHLKKLMVLDAWHHKDFTVSPPRNMTDEDIKRAYEFNASSNSLSGMSLAEFTTVIRAQETRTDEYASREWAENRPSSYQTWQQIAQVLATGDTSYYRPTLPANTHWVNWPEAGSL